jgi:hypothetical protein
MFIFIILYDFCLLGCLQRFSMPLTNHRHGSRTAKETLLFLRACLLWFPRDRHPASLLARWLLPSNVRSTDPKRTPLLLLCACLNVFTEPLHSNRCPTCRNICFILRVYIKWKTATVHLYLLIETDNKIVRFGSARGPCSRYGIGWRLCEEGKISDYSWLGSHPNMEMHQQGKLLPTTASHTAGRILRSYQ